MTNKYIDEVPKDLFSNLQQIGSGSFSDIFSATHNPTNVKVSLKISLKEQNEESLQVLKKEVEINKILFHPFICKFFTEIVTEHLHIIVMEYINGVSSLDYVNEMSGISDIEARSLLSQLIIAIEYLHNEAHITHRDLKLENIMIDLYGHIRLIDFGFSSMKTIMSTCCGTIPYCAPEVLLRELYTCASDIWSLGIILYAFLNGNLPFVHQNINTLVELIVGSEVFYPDNMDIFARDLLQKMLNKDPDQRITIEEIKSHPFLSSEKILQIDYKQLFTPQSKTVSSILKFYNAPEKVLLKPPKFPRNVILHSSLTNPLRKQNNHAKPTKNFDVSLQERILIKTDNIDLLIESRKDFAANLHQLINSAFQKFNANKNNMMLAISCETISEIHMPTINQVQLPKKDFEVPTNWKS